MERFFLFICFLFAEKILQHGKHRKRIGIAHGKFLAACNGRHKYRKLESVSDGACRYLPKICVGNKLDEKRPEFINVKRLAEAAAAVYCIDKRAYPVGFAVGIAGKGYFYSAVAIDRKKTDPSPVGTIKAERKSLCRDQKHIVAASASDRFGKRFRNIDTARQGGRNLAKRKKERRSGCRKIEKRKSVNVGKL